MADMINRLLLFHFILLEKTFEWCMEPWNAVFVQTCHVVL